MIAAVFLMAASASASTLYRKTTVSLVQPPISSATTTVDSQGATVTLTPAVHWSVDTSDSANLISSGHVGLFYNDAGSRANSSELQLFGSALTNYTLPTVNLDHADCAELSLSKSTLTVTFKSFECYDQAKSDWKSTDELLFLSTRVDCDDVVGNDFCHLIAHGLSFDESNAKVSAIYTVADAESLISSADFHWGQYTPPSAFIEKRQGIVGITTPAVISMNQSYPFSLDLSSNTVNLPWGSAYAINNSGLYCVGCELSGSVLIAGQASYTLFGGGLTHAQVHIDTSIQAALAIGFNLPSTSSTTKAALGSIKLLNFNYNIISLISTLELDMTTTLSISKDLALLAGVTFALPSASATFDLLGKRPSIFSGWNPTITPILNSSGIINGAAGISFPITLATMLEVFTTSISDSIVYQADLAASIQSNHTGCSGLHFNASASSSLYNTFNGAAAIVIGTPSMAEYHSCM